MSETFSRSSYYVKKPPRLTMAQMGLKVSKEAREANRDTYSTWSQMIYRCTNPKCPDWQYYGGKGVAVCERWRSFKNFLEDMGPRPPGLTIDRINGNGNYEPGNCRWATRAEQMQNRTWPKKYKTKKATI